MRFGSRASVHCANPMRDLVLPSRTLHTGSNRVRYRVAMQGASILRSTS